MTEADWNSCADPRKALEFLRGKASDRKRRLFACGWCRCWGHLLVNLRSRNALAVAEAYADGQATKEVLKQARRAAASVARGDRREWAAPKWAAAAAVCAASVDIRSQLPSVAYYLRKVLTLEGKGEGGNRQEVLLRCLFDNPFRPLPRRPFPAHVVGLARACNEAFPAASQDYKFLADALADLGEEAAAAHCREAAHAKGCHVLDGILGRV